MNKALRYFNGEKRFYIPFFILFGLLAVMCLFKFREYLYPSRFLYIIAQLLTVLSVVFSVASGQQQANNYIICCFRAVICDILYMADQLRRLLESWRRILCGNGYTEQFGVPAWSFPALAQSKEKY